MLYGFNLICLYHLTQNGDHTIESHYKIDRTSSIYRVFKQVTNICDKYRER